MKKYFFYCAIFVCFISIGSYAFSEIGIMEIYNNITAMAAKITPASYRVRIENKKFEEALNELPEEILTGGGEPTVAIYFSKGEGVEIIIENIDSDYASIFSYIEDYFKFSGISKVQNPVEFKAIIDSGKIELHQETEDSVVVKAWDPEKEERDDNYALFYLDKRKWVINKAVYYLDGEPFVRAENSYKSFGKYYMPYKIVLTSLNENTSDIFLFKNYKFTK